MDITEEQLDAFMRVLRNRPYIFEALMDGNSSGHSVHLVGLIAENYQSGDGFIHITCQRLTVTEDRVKKDIYDRPIGIYTERIGNFRVWLKKQKPDGRGHFSANSMLLFSAFGSWEEIESELEVIKKKMELIEEIVWTPSKRDSYVLESKQFTFRQKK